jgi:hypothetical protein
MQHRKLVAGVATLSLVGAGTGVALGAGGKAPSRANIVAVSSTKVKVNRYVQEGIRWKKDTYQVRSGGTLRIVNNAPDTGPHTFTVLKKSDLPKTPRAILNCAICNKLGQAHGADPNSEAPPKFLFLENGVGSATAPNVDRAGDSAFIDAKKGASVTLKVTAKKGATLRFICLVHPWMQAKVVVR